MGTGQSFATKPSTIGFVASVALSAIAIRRHGDRQSNADARLKKLFVASASSKNKEKVAVDKQFFKRVWRLLKIMCPGLLTPEFGYAALVATMLVSPTRTTAMAHNLFKGANERGGGRAGWCAQCRCWSCVRQARPCRCVLNTTAAWCRLPLRTSQRWPPSLCIFVHFWYLPAPVTHDVAACADVL